MNIDPSIKVEKTEIINKLLEEVYHFVEELEQQVRENLHNLKQGMEDGEEVAIAQTQYSNLND
jgi:formyltetrahydrofolate synthetase